MPDPSRLDDVVDLLASPRRMAVLGAHPEVHRPAHYVPAYMMEQGWTAIPVNPTRAGQSLFGQTIRTSLADVGPVDLIDVFRPSHALAGHLEELLATGASVVWFQLGIRDDAVAATLREAGIRVVQDRCLLADHRAWLAAG